MAIDFTGINNENEFYTHHYLTAILEKDLKSVLSKWKASEKDDDQKSPYNELRGITQDYFKLRNQEKKTRRPEEKLSIQQQFLQRLLEILGYDYSPGLKEIENNTFLPIACEITKQSGAPELWIIEALDESSDDIDPFELVPHSCQISTFGSEHADAAIPDAPFEEIITRQIFGMSEPPRWVLLVNFSQIILIDRTKWNQKRLLRFDLSEIFGRREITTFQVTAVLLHRDSICPPDGLSLLDNLDENSHKHAFAVSEDLKYALRQSIELLGNEAIYYLREKRRKGVFTGDEKLDEGQLTIECLRYMYRLLFLFYIEARPELGYAPMKSDAYRMGYSLETLRDLEMVPLTSEESRNGVFIHESLQLLFDLIYDGFHARGTDVQLALPADSSKPEHHTFKMSSLKSHLFDPDRTQLLNRVKFRNFVLQEIIQKMSLSKPKTKKAKSNKNRRGRISYAQLGINQLGAVYEALLSYRGFFAKTDLYEVKKAKEAYNELDTAYFVKAADLEKYTEDERVYIKDENTNKETLKKYAKGDFIYRLAGRDREKSASYYTPEVLTRCLVKYALKELLKDKKADDILNLTICEPAMGSAAFLNEAVNQLAEAYLQLKQEETGIDIPHDAYTQEKQKVKMYMADNNVYGVDLNPVAVELAEVSLWLNTIHEGAFVPWFGMQLVCGNSLIGARKQAFDSLLLRKSRKTDPLWLDEVPKRIMPGDKRPKNSVYHFLLPDRGMADYKDKVIKQMVPDEIKTINEWKKEFIKPFTKNEIEQLEKLSETIDNLWKKHIEDLQVIKRRTTDPFVVFGQEAIKNGTKFTDNRWKDKVLNQELYSENVRSSSVYRRLKLVMDYWCALWFWSIEKADLLPSRHEMMLEITLILEGNVYDTKPQKNGQYLLFPETQPKEQVQEMVSQYGFVDVDRLCRENERLKLVRELSEKYRFLHWELEFADLFEDRGGFDLVLGNPPWIKYTWQEGDILGEIEPLYVLRRFKATQIQSMRTNMIKKYSTLELYLKAYQSSQGTQNYISSLNNYSYLKGIQTNLYKCFLPQAWMIGKECSISAFIHPEGVYDDPKGGILRQEIYSRLCFHFQFWNELKLFKDVQDQRRFSINILENTIKQVDFINISNLFTPKTIDTCFLPGRNQRIQGIKNSNNKWNISGDQNRIIRITENALVLFDKIYDNFKNLPLKARLPAIHGNQILNSLDKLSKHKTLNKGLSQCVSTRHWDETNSQKDQTIKRFTSFPDQSNKIILSGSHIYVNNPLYKTPNKNCKHQQDFSIIDLQSISANYYPRTNYLPNIEIKEYLARIPKVTWGVKKVTDYYRLGFRAMLPPSGERTLVSAILPKQCTHINGIISVAFKSYYSLLGMAAYCSSVIGDFYVKSMGRSNLHHTWYSFPIIKINPEISLRVLMLNCLTIEYSDLWRQCWDDIYNLDSWTISNSRLGNQFKNLKSEWSIHSSLRSDFQRRQAQIELDVLISQNLGLSLNELKNIYIVQFSVLRQNDADTWYDQNG